MMAATRRYNRATFHRVTAEVGTNVQHETVTRPCSSCREPHAGKHHYCAPCRAAYMRGRRVVWKAKRDSGQILDGAQPVSEGDPHE